jgi:hypothetical protein
MNGMLIVMHKVKIDPKLKAHDGYIDISFATKDLKKFVRLYHQYFDRAIFPIGVQDESESRTKLTTTFSMYLVEYGGQEVDSFLDALKENFRVVFG